MRPMKITYFINQYPKVSHSFIRREILALEELGFEIQRIALRGWDEVLPDPIDQLEKGKTRFVLKRGVVGLIMPAAGSRWWRLDSVTSASARNSRIKAERPPFAAPLGMRDGGLQRA